MDTPGLWDATTGGALCELPATTGLPSGLPANKGGAGKLMCRACVFSPDGKSVLAVQSGGRGASYATRWEIEGEGEATKSNPATVGKLSDNPVPCLSISADGKVVAAGDVEGQVTILNATSLTKVKSMPLHGLPVTSISMIPSTTAFGGLDIATGSADKRVVISSSKGGRAAPPVRLPVLPPPSPPPSPLTTPLSLVPLQGGGSAMTYLLLLLLMVLVFLVKTYAL